jgi:uncharacterized protein YodC (DUF2158 family)
LGAIAVDYVSDGQTLFLLGWLMPHGVIEIPAILVGGQAGLVLAGALIGWGNRERIGIRLREVSGDVVTLKSGGQPMTVAAIDESNVECLWIGDDGELFRESIPSIARTVVTIEDDELEDEDDAEHEEHDKEEHEDEDEDKSSKRKRRSA